MDLYNNKNVGDVRSGVAYCVRKGKIKDIPLDLSNAFLIDNLKHKEIAKIFKKVKYFISFDPYTAFSRYAALCGCISIVVPYENLSEEEWISDPVMRYGISYGFASVDEALLTVDKLKFQMNRFNPSDKSPERHSIHSGSPSPLRP
jgi:hypothetical protein